MYTCTFRRIVPKYAESTLYLWEEGGIVYYNDAKTRVYSDFLSENMKNRIYFKTNERWVGK